MPIDADVLKHLIEDELERLSDARVKAHVRGLLVEPTVVFRDWDYGKPGEQYPCWTVLSDNKSNTGIAFCENGFGPRMPWGLVWLGGEHMSMGMDSGWFAKFLEAYFESFAATQLAIWRVFKTDPLGIREPVTDENSWESTWEIVTQWRKADPAARYDCDHSIVYGR